jgi:hypothetical protein
MITIKFEVSGADKLVNEVYLTLARHLRGVARPHFSVHAEHVLFHREQSLLYVLLIWLVEPFAIRT